MPGIVWMSLPSKRARITNLLRGWVIAQIPLRSSHPQPYNLSWIHHLFMDQMASQRVKEEITSRSPSDDDPHLIKDKQLNRGDELSLNRGQFGSDLDPGDVGVGPPENNDDGSVGERDAVRFDGTEEVRTVDKPPFLTGAELAELLAGYAAHLRRVDPPRHFWSDRSLWLQKLWIMKKMNKSI